MTFLAYVTLSEDVVQKSGDKLILLSIELYVLMYVEDIQI
jgi:hypothetical protein